MITSQYVKKLGKQYFITYEMNGVRKQWQGDREKLVELSVFIDRCLAQPSNNQNGHRIPHSRD